MNLVDGATIFPVLVGNDTSLTRSEDAACRMEAVGQGNLAVVLARNLAITRGLRMVDALLLTLRVWEVWNFEWWCRDQQSGIRNMMISDSTNCLLYRVSGFSIPS